MILMATIWCEWCARYYRCGARVYFTHCSQRAFQSRHDRECKQLNVCIRACRGETDWNWIRKKSSVFNKIDSWWQRCDVAKFRSKWRLEVCPTTHHAPTPPPHNFPISLIEIEFSSLNASNGCGTKAVGRCQKLGTAQLMCEQWCSGGVRKDLANIWGARDTNAAREKSRW